MHPWGFCFVLLLAVWFYAVTVKCDPTLNSSYSLGNVQKGTLAHGGLGVTLAIALPMFRDNRGPLVCTNYTTLKRNVPNIRQTGADG